MNTWDSEELFFNGDDYFKSVLAGLKQAQGAVEFETYIFDVDPIGETIENALLETANRGVKVRLIVDGIGSSYWIERRAKLLEASGVQVRVYHPVRIIPFLFRFLNRIGFSLHIDERDAGTLSRLNRRTHRKMCLIDGTSAWVGSINISANHSGKFSGALAWRDTGAKVTGRSVQELVRSFNAVWNRSHNLRGKRRWRESLFDLKSRKQRISPLVRLNQTLNLRRRNFHDFVSRIRRAQKQVWISNAYFAPSKPVTRALIGAAKRGVDVRLLVPQKSDVFFMPWIAINHYHTLIKNGVRIFEYTPRFLHAKSAIVDDWTIVGTSNLNWRSLLHDFEVDVCLTLPASVQALEKQFVVDLKNSEEIKVARRGPVIYLGALLEYFLKNVI
jgi:cardiolipin synthase